MSLFGFDLIRGLAIVGTIYVVHMLIVGSFILVKRAEVWHAELQAGEPLSKQLYRIFLFLAANNFGAILAIASLAFIRPNEWITMIASFVIVTCGVVFNSFGILKIIQFTIASTRRSPDERLVLPPVGPPPPIPGFNG